MDGEYKVIVFLLIFSILLACASMYLYFSDDNYQYSSNEFISEKPVTIGLFVEGSSNGLELQNEK